MGLSYAVDEAELHAAEQQRNIRRCYMCGVHKTPSSELSVAKTTPASFETDSAPGRNSDAAAENVISQ